MDDLVRYAREMGLELGPREVELFAIYCTELLAWNRRVNLTGITDPAEVVVKHFIDSLTCLKVYPLAGGERLLDVGTGAGFPGVPLRIMRLVKLVLLDSARKRVRFLRELCRRLELEGVEIIHGRAEEWGRREGYREAFDVVTARAVAALNVLAELCLPFVRVGGVFLAQKGPDVGEELAAADKAIRLCGGKVEEVAEVTLPGGVGKRSLVLMRKINSTPERYPRRPGIPEKRPLGK